MEVPGKGSNWSYSRWPQPQPQQPQIQAASVTYTTAQSNAGSLTHWARLGIKPTTSWFLVGFVTAAPRWELPDNFFLSLPNHEVMYLFHDTYIYIYTYIHTHTHTKDMYKGYIYIQTHTPISHACIHIYVYISTCISGCVCMYIYEILLYIIYAKSSSFT